MRQMIRCLVFAAMAQGAFAGPEAPRKERDPVQKKAMAERWKTEIFRELGRAQTVVVCDFDRAAGGMIIRKVLRGHAKVGEFWNDATFPAKPLIIFQQFAVEDAHTTVSATWYYELNDSGEIVLSAEDGPSLAIGEVERYLKERKDDGDFQE